MRMKRNEIIWIGVAILLTLITWICGYYSGYKRAYLKGGIDGSEIGFNMALDTINAIMKEQVGSDTTISKVCLINKDTNTFYVSWNPKSIKLSK
jgi:hypothetical protein